MAYVSFYKVATGDESEITLAFNKATRVAAKLYCAHIEYEYKEIAEYSSLKRSKQATIFFNPGSARCLDVLFLSCNIEVNQEFWIPVWTLYSRQIICVGNDRRRIKGITRDKNL